MTLTWWTFVFFDDLVGHGLVSGSSGHDWSGPRFQNDFPHEVAFTPERGSTLDCMAHGQPAPHVTWLTSSSSKGELMFSFAVLVALIEFALFHPLLAENGGIGKKVVKFS